MTRLCSESCGCVLDVIHCGHRHTITPSDDSHLVVELKSDVVEYDGVEPDGITTADLFNEDLPGCVTTQLFASNSDGQVTHIWVCGKWWPLGAQEVTPERFCYDTAGWSFPTAYGGGDGSWTVAGSERLDRACSPTPTPNYPQRVEYTCDWSNSQCNVDPGTLDGLSWTDTGQAAGQPTVINATGNPDPGQPQPAGSWPCTRPTFRVKFTDVAGAGTGPYSVSFDLQDKGGCINAMLWDETEDKLLPIVSQASFPGSVVSSAMGGNILGMYTSGQTVPLSVAIAFADPYNSDPADLWLVLTAMGNYPAATPAAENERIANTELVYSQAAPAAVDCCWPVNNIAALADLLTANDPNGLRWAVDGTKVCATVDVAGQSSLYGGLALCGQAELFATVE